MRIKTKNTATGITKTIELKVGKNEDKFSIIRRLEAMQEEVDVFGLGRTGRASLGIRTIYESKNWASNVKIKGRSLECNRDHCGLVGLTSVKESSGEQAEIPNAFLDGEDTGCKVLIDMYETGWVINTGKQTSDIFGGMHSAYLKSIGTKMIHSGAISVARIFPTLKALGDYIEKHRDVFCYLASKHGYSWSVDPASAPFQEDFDAERESSSKKNEKVAKDWERVSTLLDDVNEVEQEEEFDESDIPENIGEEEMIAEAVSRMKNLNLHQPVIRDFVKDGKVFKSEFGGILYDLDDNAVKACEEVRKKGYLPYHVVLTHANFGEAYSVLYVSKNAEEWKYERRSGQGTMMNFCYNATEPLYSEYGDSRFQSVNGGLIRIA